MSSFSPKLLLSTAPLPNPFINRTYFYANEIASIYDTNPIEGETPPVVVGIISFGQGLVGTVGASGVLTGGDVQHYWANTLGIQTTLPRVVIKLIDDATNSPGQDLGTSQNTLDVETIGAIYPATNLTIILYLAPNTVTGFVNALAAATNPTSVNGTSYGTPSIISISWGAPETSFTGTEKDLMNAALQSAVNKHINVCAATGNNGSKVEGTLTVDFPSSSPYCIAVGGTTLTLTTPITEPDPLTSLPTYTNIASETVWNTINGADGGATGGGISAYFSKPSYQYDVTGLTGDYRNTPDVALVANPETGIMYYINGALVVSGGTGVSVPIMAAYLASISTSINSFVNPIIYLAYKNPSEYNPYFHDIISGRNDSAGSSGTGPYAAVVGYDNCSGVGSISGVYLTSFLSVNMPVLVTSVTVSPSEITDLILYGNQTLTPTVTPTNASLRIATWASSDASVATVNVSGPTNGSVVGQGYGTCIITYTVTETSEAQISATVSVTVPKLVTFISLLPTTQTINKGQTVTIVPTVSPSDATNKNVTWTSDDITTATVSSAGVVTGVGGSESGTAVNITCTAADGSGITATAIVTVIWIAVTGITLAPSAPTINIGTAQQITETVAPTNATIKPVTWSSSNPRKAPVNPQGLVTALGSTGTNSVTITARATDGSGTGGLGITGTAAITVQSNPITAITISGPTTVQKGSAIQMAAAFTSASGGNPTSRYVKWTVTFTTQGGRANISSTGRLIGTKAGAVTVNATALNGITDTYTVTVTA